MKYFLLLIAGLAGYWIGQRLAIKRKLAMRMKTQELNQFEMKEENKKKLADYIKTQDKVTNNEVEKLLGVSDATATRYLDDLEKQGLIKQEGGSGRSVFYTSTQPTSAQDHPEQS